METGEAGQRRGENKDKDEIEPSVQLEMTLNIPSKRIKVNHFSKTLTRHSKGMGQIERSIRKEQFVTG